ncbi:MAG: hypothetical protein ACI9FJ_002767 [Alteromonadaceae bacterium]|jgi:hypothetical protein
MTATESNLTQWAVNSALLATLPLTTQNPSLTSEFNNQLLERLS